MPYSFFMQNPLTTEGSIGALDEFDLADAADAELPPPTKKAKGEDVFKGVNLFTVGISSFNTAPRQYYLLNVSKTR